MAEDEEDNDADQHEGDAAVTATANGLLKGVLESIVCAAKCAAL